MKIVRTDNSIISVSRLNDIIYLVVNDEKKGNAAKFSRSACAELIGLLKEIVKDENEAT